VIAFILCWYKRYTARHQTANEGASQTNQKSLSFVCRSKFAILITIKIIHMDVLIVLCNTFNRFVAASIDGRMIIASYVQAYGEVR
jgi:hypothetical protein